MHEAPSLGLPHLSTTLLASRCVMFGFENYFALHRVFQLFTLLSHLGSLAAFIPCALDLKSLNPILNLISYKHYGLLNPPKIATLKPSSPKLKLQSHDNCEAEAPPVPPRMLALDNLDVSRLGFGFPTTRTPLKTTPET